MEQEQHPTKGETAAGLIAVGGLVAILANFAIIGLPLEAVAFLVYSADQLRQMFGSSRNRHASTH